MDVPTTIVVVLAALFCQAAERPAAGDASRRRRHLAADAARVAIAVAVGYLLLAAAVDLPSARHQVNARDAVAGDALQIGAGVLTLLLLALGTGRVPGLRGLRSGVPISWLTVALYLQALAGNLTPSTGEASVTAVAGAPQTTRDLVLGSLPFALLGVAAVGPVVRRQAAETVTRLGLVPVRPAWWVLGAAVGIALVPLGDPVATALGHLTPADCLQQQSHVAQSLQGVHRAVIEQLAIAMAAAVGEETLFRGALQPRIGILASSILWSSFHLQYTCHGLPSAANLYILLLGLVFGALRRRMGLTSAIAAHTTYDLAILLGWFG